MQVQGRSRQAWPQQSGAQKTRWHLRAPDFLTLCETHSSGATRRGQSLLSAPVRLIVACTVVGDVESASPIGADRIDLFVGPGSGSTVVFIGYLLTGRRVGREVVVRGVIGDWLPASPVGFDGVDLIVPSDEVGICYPLAIGSVVGVVVI